MSILAFILLRKTALNRVDWNGILYESDPTVQLVLISDLGAINQLDTHTKNQFHALVELEKMTFESIQMFMDDYLARHFHNEDKVRIATFHEFHLLDVGLLRDRYRDTYNTEGPGFETLQDFRNKLRMKKILENSPARIPKYYAHDSALYSQHPDRYLDMLEYELGYPMFTKPIDSAGSIGTKKILARSMLKNWCDEISTSDTRFEIDSFIDGILFHCDSIIVDGKPVRSFVSQYLHPNADALSGKGLATITLSPESTDYKSVQSFAESSLMQFPIVPDGITHMEIFKDNKNNLIFLEVAARPPGAGVREMYKIRYNLDIFLIQLRSHLGLSIAPIISQYREGSFAAMHQLLTPPQGGTIYRMHQPEFEESKSEVKWYIKEGDTVDAASSLFDVMVSTIFWHNEYQQLALDFKKLDEQKLVEFIPAYHESPCMQIKTSGTLKKLSPLTICSRRSEDHHLTESQSNHSLNSSLTSALSSFSMFSMMGGTLTSAVSTSYHQLESIRNSNFIHDSKELNWKLLPIGIDPICYIFCLSVSLAIVSYIIWKLMQHTPSEENETNLSNEFKS